MNSKYLNILFALVLIISSCSSPNYLINKKEIPQIVYEQYQITDIPYKLQPYDYLYIDIKTTNEEINELFSNLSSKYNTGLMTNESNFYLTGYMINDSGYVFIPYVGNIKAAGKTIDELRKIISDSVQKKVNDAVINVRLASFYVYLLGEVTKQGKIYFYKDKATILEALAQGQGIAPTGDKRKVMVIRRQDTVFKVFVLDLTKRKILEQKDFFVKPNDIIYVPERPAAKFQAFVKDYLTFITFLSSTATTLILIMTLTNGR